MIKTISFSLWGSNPKYTIGAIQNALLAQTIYPDWVCEFHVGINVPFHIIDALKEQPNTKITYNPDLETNWKSMFWRFHTGYQSDISIFRDTDSRLSRREKFAVDEWLATDKTFHIMRDHPFHKFPILGGMWGFKNNGKYDLKKLLDLFIPSDKYGTDYEFFSKILYPLINDDKVVHDEFFDNKPFPTLREGSEFVGDVFDENNIRHPEYHLFIK